MEYGFIEKCRNCQTTYALLTTMEKAHLMNFNQYLNCNKTDQLINSHTLNIYVSKFIYFRSIKVKEKTKN